MTSRASIPEVWAPAIPGSRLNRVMTHLIITLPVVVGTIVWLRVAWWALGGGLTGSLLSEGVFVFFLGLPWIGLDCYHWPQRQSRGSAHLGLACGQQGAPGRGPDESATLFPVVRLRWLRWLPLLLGLVVHLIMALASMTVLRPEGQRSAGQMPCVLALVDLVLLAWLLGRLLRPDEAWPVGRWRRSRVTALALMPSGIRVGSRLFIAWEELHAVEAELVGTPSPRGPDHFRPGVRLEWGDGQRLTIRLDGHPQHPAAIFALLKFFAENPSMRHELGQPASVERCRRVTGEIVRG